MADSIGFMMRSLLLNFFRPFQALDGYLKALPALYDGLYLLPAIYLALYPDAWIAALTPLLMLITAGAFQRDRRRLLRGFGVILAGILYINILISTPSENKLPVAGQASLRLTEMRPQRSFFAKGKERWLIYGQLVSFIPEGETKSVAHQIPVVMSVGYKPPLVKEATFFATLSLSRSGYRLKPASRSWQSQGEATLLRWRLKARQAIDRYLHSHLCDQKQAGFLSGMVTGQFSDPTLLFDFGRFGLQHLMAISGFHFSLLALLLGAILRRLLPYKLAAILLLLLLTLYFLLVGGAPSILRAYIMASIGLGALLINRQAAPLNSLGVALIAVLLIDPFACKNIGFQFSFLCTAAILILYQPVEKTLRSVLPSYSFSLASWRERLDFCGGKVINGFRKALALTLAVNAVALPLTLLIFHKFPLMSLVYNLFFPALTSLAMLLFFIAVGISWLVPPLGELLFWGLSLVLRIGLDFTHYLPAWFDLVIRVNGWSGITIVLYLLCLLCGGLCFRSSSFFLDAGGRSRYIAFQREEPS
jgi:competence protein ComEC